MGHNSRIRVSRAVLIERAARFVEYSLARFEACAQRCIVSHMGSGLLSTALRGQQGRSRT